MISMETRVWQAVDQIDTDPEFWPVVEPGDGNLYLLNTSQRIFGTLIYTVFNAETRFPDSSWAVKYGSQHYIHQVLFSNPMIRERLTYIVDDVIPGLPREEFNPMIIPGCTPTYPTEVRPKQHNFI